MVVTFGGCYNEYVHSNDLHIFDFSKFFEDPLNSEITCTKVESSGNVPSTRSGHSACAY